MAKTALALGTFDGVHIGHLSVINAAVLSGYNSVAVAFPVPPRCTLSGNTELLTTPFEKNEILRAARVNRVHFLDFESIQNIEPEDFLLFLKSTFNPALISCGFNYRFGRGGKGDTALLERFCSENGIVLSVAEAVKTGEQIVSSTLIRDLLKKGDIKSANRFLSCPFGFSAEIIHGDKRGRTIGFPTVNQYYPEIKAGVRYGVYKSRITVDGKTYDGITNVGVRPTFQLEKVMAETFILDFTGEIYGKIADVRLLEFLREEQLFSSVEELKAAIEKDIEAARSA